MNREMKRDYIKNHVLTIGEVASMLNVSRQMVRDYVKKEVLIPAKKAPNGLLFLKEDVSDYINNHYSLQIQERAQKNREIIGQGSSRIGKTWIRENIQNYDDIVSIKVYFEDYDAILDNYFTLEDEYVDNELLRIAVPTFILALRDGNEYWFDCFTCGYEGFGPHETESLLAEIGIAKDKLKDIFLSKKISFFKNQGEWEVAISESRYRETKENRMLEDVGVYKFITDISGEVYMYNRNLVLLENAKFNRYRDSTTKEFLDKYIDFIPHPISLSVLSKETAINTGHFTKLFAIEGTYQIILKDWSGRELWFQRTVTGEPLNKQETIREILQRVGFDFIEKEESWSDTLKKWLNFMPKVEDVRTIELNM